MWNSPAPVTLTRDHTRRGGRHSSLAEAARPGGTHLKLCRGAYVQRADVEHLNTAQRHKLTVLAMLSTGRLGHDAVIARESAAVLHGIPLIGKLPAQVQLTHPLRGGGRLTPGCRTLSAPEDYEAQIIDGVRVSSPTQTLVDLGRRRSLASNLAGLDHALHTGTLTKERILEVSQRHPRSRGNGKLLAALAAANPLAESPGESLSRAVMLLHRLPPPELQVEVLDQSGRLVGRVDFMWREFGVIGEFDGQVKYTRALTGRPIEEIVLEERRREIQLERVTGMRVARWTWGDAYCERGLLAILADAGVVGKC